MDQERAAMLATMYQEPDTDPIAASVGTTRTRKIRVGVIEYEVPSVAYVQQLEHAVQQQRRMLDQVLRLLNRSQVGHTRTIDNLRRELTDVSTANTAIRK